MCLHSKKQTPTRAFTLLELIITITIIVLLAGVLTPLVKSAIDDAKVAKFLSVVSALKKAASKYQVDTGNLPGNGLPVETWIDLFGNDGAPNWKGPYLDHPLSNNDIPWSYQWMGGGMLTNVLLYNSVMGVSGTGYDIAGSIIPAGARGVELRVIGLPLGVGTKIDLAIDGVSDAQKGRCQFETAPSDPTAEFLSVLILWN